MRISKSYRFDFDHPVDRLWALVSDTPRWGEASGFPKYQVREELQDDGTVRIFGSSKLAGISLNWEEPPVDWVANHWFEQTRLFLSGPIASMTTSASLEDRGPTSGLTIDLGFETRNLIGAALARFLVGAYETKVRELLEAADNLIRAEQPDLFVSPYQPDAAVVARANQIARTIEATPYDHGLVARLIEFIHRNQEVDLWTMRPIALARRWGVAAREVIELFLQGVRSGLLESRWDILCPRCRISMSPVSNMNELPQGMHCDACNIDFEADFARNVELSFSPSPSIRSIENGFFCRSGPGVTPHIRGQCRLEPGRSRQMPLKLEAGSYRVRTLEAGDEARLSWDGGPFPQIRVIDNRVELGDPSADGEIDLVNDGKFHRTVVIEEQSWLEDVLTAEQVTTMQAFRDLFSDQVLRPGDEVSIRNISFMFTDLVGSSALFASVGDAQAYRMVREHFADLERIVRQNQGNIVKTVGDGIHAAFLLPDDALRAALEIQQSVPEFNRRLGSSDCAVRIGLHSGSSISVTLNDRLDYYGESVNLAARLEGLANAGGVAMSRAFSKDPAVAQLLESQQTRIETSTLKGYLNPVEIIHLVPAGPIANDVA